MSDLPPEVAGWIGQERYGEESEFEVERGYVLTACSSVENANPLYWDEKAAREITGGWIAPPSMISVWCRPHRFAPGRKGEGLALKVHFDLKEKLGLPEAIMTDDELVFHRPVRLGDRVRSHQVLRSVSEPKTTKLGRGRFWTIEVVYENQKRELLVEERITGFGYQRSAGERSAEQGAQGAAQRAAGARSGESGGETRIAADLTLDRVAVGQELPELAVDVTATTVVLGALATRDWRPMHHDRDFAKTRNGVRDIFLNTPNLAHWFERYLSDWTGPRGRPGRMKFFMRGSVFAGDRMVFRGEVTGVETDAAGCGWAAVDVNAGVGGEVKTACAARVAIPTRPDDNPWRREGDAWRP
jgi:acyl dehydratase